MPGTLEDQAVAIVQKQSHITPEQLLKKLNSPALRLKRRKQEIVEAH